MGCATSHSPDVLGDTHSEGPLSPGATLHIMRCLVLPSMLADISLLWDSRFLASFVFFLTPIEDLVPCGGETVRATINVIVYLYEGFIY